MKVEIFIPEAYYSLGYTLEQAKMSVQEGWHGLLDMAFAELTKYPNILITQVKEKFGGLRIYTNPMNDDFENIIMQLEVSSFTMCEMCGNAGKLRIGGWMKTLCEEHADGRPATSPF